MRIHIHTGRLRRTIDLRGDDEAKVDPELEAFIEALIEAVARAEGRTGDEEFGHEFHGNQYVEVAGQGKEDEEEGKPKGEKPTKASASGAKAAVHELLSSGHAFTLEELMQATGAKTQSTLLTALSDLKNPKYAGKIGAISIEKLASGHYQLSKAPVKAVNPASAAAAVVAKAKAPPKSVAKAAEAMAPSSMKSNVKPLKAEPMTHGWTPMEAEQANAIYQGVMHQANVEAMEAMQSPTSSTAAIAHAWKQSKLNAMAQWSANTSGNATAAKEAEVFEADKKLMFDLAAAKPDSLKQDFAMAISKWKMATVKEKQAAAAAAKPKPKPAPATAPSKPTKAEKAAPVPAGTPSLPVPESIMPEDHVSVGSHDFTTGTFSAEMGKLYSSLAKGHPNSVENKKSVSARLTERLKDSKSFSWLKENVKAIQYSSLEATLIASWASSSGDGKATSCALQLAAKEVFNMKDEHVEMAALSHVKTHGELTTYKRAAENLGLTLDTSEKVAAFKSALQDFTLAQYHATQEHFKQLGLKHVYIARGMKTSVGAKNEKVNLKLQPASSFSANYGTAHGFSGGHSVFLAKVPVEQVLSSYVTGYGCTNEHELVVLAHPNTQAVHIDAAYAHTLEGAVQHVKNKVTKWA